jgi:xanthine dehydrogenase molybdenum-binding subunit
MAVELTVNGARVRLAVEPGESLLDALRERCGLRSPKDGCQPQGQCGACLALVDGKPKTSCAVPAEACEGREMLTVEGLSERERAILSRAFAAAAGVQCGYCTPGLVLRAKHLFDRNPRPTRAEIARAIDGHLCRCTGYVKVIDAIELAARGLAGEPMPEAIEGGVGASVERADARALALGERPFVADMTREGLLHGAVVLSRHARARVLRVGTARARALPGVRAIATAADVPGERWYGLLRDDWPGFVAEGEEVRCVGDVLAAVAADDERTARAAARLVEVDYEPLVPVVDPREALRDGAPRVNPKHANLLGRSVVVRGDVDAALAASAHVVSGTWRTQRVEHLFLEPECALAEPLPDGALALYTQGQGVFEDRRQVARFLGVPEERVHVELVPPGGAFGGKEDLSIQPHAALLATMTGRAVRVKLDRDQSIRMHPKRHPIELAYTVGCDAEGRLTAVLARMLGDSGAYASVGDKVLERAAGHACGPYRAANVDVEALAVTTNHPPSGAMRGFGANQAAFAIEGCIDLLAKEVGLDGWEMRARNLVAAGDATTTGQVLAAPGGARRTLDAVKAAYYGAKAAGRAVGIACGVKNAGIGNGVEEWGRCRLAVEADGSITLHTGFSEMGQGLFTVLAQLAAEVTGLRASAFRPRAGSTFALDCGQTTASRGTMLGGRAVVRAAEQLRAELDRGRALAELAGRVFAADEVVRDTTPVGAPGEIKTHTAYGWAAQVVILDAEGRIERVVAAHDVGRVVNPALCAGQIEGSIHMGLGYALTEELPCEDGAPVTTKLRELGVLRARDMPACEVILLEEPEPEGPFGAKGVGEIGLVPTAAAVAGALEAFDGVRRTTLPMKDSPAARAMSVGRIQGDRTRWR